MRLKTYKMAMSILPKFLTLKRSISRTIWRIEIGDGSFFCIFHALFSVVVYARDTDILVLLLAHFEKMPCKNLWLKAGTYKKPKYFPIHELHQDLPKSQIESILAFHAITGCDNVSFIAGHSKKSAWKVFGTHYELLCDLGKAELTSEVIQSAEKFICLL